MNNIRKLRVQLVKYLFIGGLGILLDFSIYVALLFLHTPVAVAKGTGVVASVIYSYFANGKLTFAVKLTMLNAIKFCIVYGISIIQNIWTNSFVINIWPADVYPYVFAFFIATFISVCINFMGLKLWVFK